MPIFTSTPNRESKTVLLKALLCFGMMVNIASTPNIALAITVTGSNDVSPISSKEYVLGAMDAHLVFEIKHEWLSQINNGSQILNLPISIVNNLPEQTRAVRLELFYAHSGKAKSAPRFDPLHRLIYPLDLDGASAQSLSLTIPNSIDLQQTDVLRLDIDGCQGCTLETEKETRSVTLESSMGPQRIYDGASEIGPTGVQLSTRDWDLVDAEFKEQAFITTGVDPHLISPILDIAPASLGGLLLSLSVVSDGTEDAPSWGGGIIEVFHMDDQHGFHPRAATLLQMQTPAEDSISLPFQVFVPLGHLASEKPAISVVEKLRVDLPIISGGHWMIGESLIVGLAQASALSDQTPPLIRHVTPLRSTGINRLLLIVQKMVRDWPFFLAYFCLVGFCGWRTYRFLI